jgi:hypothetical protein
MSVREMMVLIEREVKPLMADRDEAITLLRSIPANWSEHRKSCICDHCERTRALLDRFPADTGGGK